MCSIAQERKEHGSAKAFPLFPLIYTLLLILLLPLGKNLRIYFQLLSRSYSSHVGLGVMVMVMGIAGAANDSLANLDV